jgi:hypothetical protein
MPASRLSMAVVTTDVRRQPCADRRLARIRIRRLGAGSVIDLEESRAKGPGSPQVGTGIVTMNVLLCPDVSTAISPPAGVRVSYPAALEDESVTPCSWTIVCAIDKPRPLPPMSCTFPERILWKACRCAVLALEEELARSRRRQRAHLEQFVQVCWYDAGSVVASPSRILSSLQQTHTHTHTQTDN